MLIGCRFSRKEGTWAPTEILPVSVDFFAENDLSTEGGIP